MKTIIMITLFYLSFLTMLYGIIQNNLHITGIGITIILFIITIASYLLWKQSRK